MIRMLSICQFFVIVLFIMLKQTGGGGNSSINTYFSQNSNNISAFNISSDFNLSTSNNNSSSIDLAQSTQIPFHFHILTDGINDITKEKLREFEACLNELYPCKFSIYTFCDSVFYDLPKLNGNYLTYFRLKLASYLPQDIKTCLYLDVDMLCMQDIRDIFNIDLQDKVCGVVLDADFRISRIMEGKNNNGGYALNVKTYFNAGLMLINLDNWRKQNIENQCFSWLAKYIPECHDQDTLNAVIEDKILILPLNYNFMIGHLENREESSFKGNNGCTLAYTYKQYLSAKDDIKILHFLTERKPWHTLGYDLNGIIINSQYRNTWWEMAFKTPIFSKDLQTLFMFVLQQSFIDVSNFHAGILHTTNKIIRRPHKYLFRTIKRLLKRFFKVSN